MIATAFVQDDADKASRQWRLVADQLRPKVPKLSALIDEAEHDVLAYMSFPQRHRVKLHSTNPLERVNGKIKRRTEAVGIFPDEARITRLVDAILLDQNHESAVRRARYMTLEAVPARKDPQDDTTGQPRSVLLFQGGGLPKMRSGRFVLLSKGRANKAVVVGGHFPALLRARRRRER